MKQKRQVFSALMIMIITALFSIFLRALSTPDDEYELAVTNFGPLNTDIFIADEKGFNEKPLLEHPALDYNASFSSDGNWILFTSEREGNADIYRVHPDGTSLERLTGETCFEDQASLSPDGRQLAFVSSCPGNADIFILDLQSKKKINITQHPGGDFRPSWSPDGKWLAFSSDRESQNPRFAFETTHSTEIFIIRPDGSGLKKITATRAFSGSPEWSADGKRLLFYETSLQDTRLMVSPLRKGKTQLTVVDIRNGKLQQLTGDSSEKLSPEWVGAERIAWVRRGTDAGIEFSDQKKGARGEFNCPDWSPDQKRMVFHRERGGRWPPLTPMYSRDKRFRVFKSGVFASGSPDGSKLICNDKRLAVQKNGIMTVDRVSMQQHILFADSVRSILAPVYSPDGGKIAFGLGQFFQMVRGAGNADIALINADGSGLKILTSGSGNFGFPSWSPDGHKLVCRVATDSLNGLVIIDLQSGQLTRLTSGNTDNFPSWSPDGEWIAFTGKREGNYDIYLIRPDGSGLQRLTRTERNEAHCTWSPDGEWIAFAGSYEGFKDESVLHVLNPQPYGEICVMRKDGSDMRILTDNQFEDGTPGWLPKGRK